MRELKVLMRLTENDESDMIDAIGRLCWEIRKNSVIAKDQCEVEPLPA